VSALQARPAGAILRGVSLAAISLLASLAVAATAEAQKLFLDLSLSKTEFVQGESIPFLLSLTNRSSSPIEVAGASPQNRAFSIAVSGPNGFRRTADTASVLAREGEWVDEPRGISGKTLQPGENLVVRADLVSWLGELEPGDYQLVGSYDGMAALRTDSRSVKLQVTAASIAYVRPLPPDPSFAYQLRDSVWMNRVSRGFDLFLLRSSARLPSVIYSNRRVAHLENFAAPVAAGYAGATQAMRHIAWILPPETLMALRVEGNDAPGAPQTIRLPADTLQEIESAFTDSDSTLHLVLGSPDGRSAGLLRVASDGKTTFAPIQQGLPFRPPIRALWCKDRAIVLAWVGAGKVQAYAATVAPNSSPRFIEGKPIALPPSQVEDVALAERPRDGGESYDRLAIILCREPSTAGLFRRRVNLESGRAEEEKRLAAPAALAELLESVLAEDLSPRYLFAGKDGNVYFFDSNLSRAIPVVDRKNKLVSNSAFPALLIASRYSKTPGTYVRFVEDGKRFAYAKVE
jgi:hypothetical protein